MTPTVEVIERSGCQRITITTQSGESYIIEAAEKGIVLTSHLDDMHLVVHPKTSNQILIFQTETPHF